MAVSNMENNRRSFGDMLALSEVMNVGVLELDANGEVIFANPLACRLLGSINETSLMQSWPRLQTLLRLNGDMKTTQHRSLTVNLDVENNNQMLLRLEVEAVDREAGSGHLVLLRDRRVVDSLEADLILASQMRAQVHLYGALTHDLRAPLNAMQIAMELLTDTLGDAPTAADKASTPGARQRRYIEVLREELSRLNRSMQAILDHRTPLNSVAQPFDLCDVIRESADILRPQAGRQKVVLQIALPEGSAIVFGYRDRLKQAILNIALSGLIDMQDGGSLEIDLTLNGEAIAVRLRHTGSAIPEAVLKQIYQVHFTHGDHIGLYVARLVIESHEGDISVQNPPNGGVVFMLTFPYTGTVLP
jgi:signal transduction histidine kinase